MGKTEGFHTTANRYKVSSDTTIYFEVDGEGQLPIVFLHGFANDLHVWNSLRGLFPKDSVTMFFLDLKGFGRSSKPRSSDYSLNEQAWIVLRFLEEWRLKECVIIGHSYGGGVALLTQLCAQRSNKQEFIGKLILLNCLCYTKQAPLYVNLLQLPILSSVFLRMIPARIKAKFMLEQTFFDHTKITQEDILIYESGYNRPGIETSITEGLSQIVPRNYGEVIDGYRKIEIPTLIVWGQQDRLIPIVHGQRLHNEIGGSQLEVINDCGHVPHMERPFETFELISGFLDFL
jgi:pimeloyl-ACP methyl ester carboxylesterase